MKETVTIDENHVYHDSAGRVVPGVTGIIRACGLMDSFGWNDYARDRGTAVHRLIELGERGTLDPASVDPVIIPYWDGWIAFKADTGYQSDTLEQLIFHPVYRYAGTLDQTGVMAGRTCVLDLKTGPYQPWWALQTAAYNAVAKKQDRYSLHINGDGKWKLHKHENKRDFSVFLACLTVAGWEAK